MPSIEVLYCNTRNIKVHLSTKSTSVKSKTELTELAKHISKNYSDKIFEDLEKFSYSHRNMVFQLPTPIISIDSFDRIVKATGAPLISLHILAHFLELEEKNAISLVNSTIQHFEKYNTIPFKLFRHKRGGGMVNYHTFNNFEDYNTLVSIYASIHHNMPLQDFINRDNINNEKYHDYIKDFTSEFSSIEAINIRNIMNNTIEKYGLETVSQYNMALIFGRQNYYGYSGDGFLGNDRLLVKDLHPLLYDYLTKNEGDARFAYYYLKQNGSVPKKKFTLALLAFTLASNGNNSLFPDHKNAIGQIYNLTQEEVATYTRCANYLLENIDINIPMSILKNIA